MNFITKNIFILFFFGFNNLLPNDYKSVKKNQRLLNEVYEKLIIHYVDEIDLDGFTKLSINNMLSELDPYTTYMEKEERSGIELLTKGKYGGIGIQIGKRDGILTIISPMENSPAKKAGILAGDKIIKIDDQDALTMSMDEAAKLIRGKKGTKINITIERFGLDEPVQYSLVRKDIKVKDVSYFGVLENEVGYIRLTRFSKNSADEVRSSIKKLMQSDISGLIFDLRDNPGGLLSNAIDILDMFTEKDQLLVSTKGKTNRSTRTYKSRREPIVPKDLKIVILINKGSASASEIISGVFQDLDRGIVIGRDSFGKGLVQTVYNINKASSIKITTAKYYLPSGRLIQKDGYLPDEILPDSIPKDSIFYTLSGRTVISGAGITPDHIVDIKPISPILSACLRSGAFFSFVQKNKHMYKQFSDVVSDQFLLNKFEKYVIDSDLDIKLKGESNYSKFRKSLMILDSTNISIQSALDILDNYFETTALGQFEREKEDLNHWLLMEFSYFFNGEEGRFKISSSKDPDIMKALSVLKDPMSFQDILLTH